MKRIYTDGFSFRNESGDHVILHGMNLVCKNKELNYLGDYHEGTLQFLKNLGFNVIRLGIIWDGVEPKPGIYNDKYLHKIRDFVQLAQKYDLYVFLDMHQDLYSYKFADGAPEWATLTDGLPHTTGHLWSDAYLISDAVKRCFDNFWNNAPAEDGIGLQDHYVNAWRYVVTKFKDCPNVIGYDLMNEPALGSESDKVFQGLISAYATHVLKLDGFDMDEMSAFWMDDSRKVEILESMGDADVYQKLIVSAQKASQIFEQEKITPLFSKVTQAIREIDSDKIIFLETSYFSNMGMESKVEKVKHKDGSHDLLQAYAPHGYDLVVDTDKYLAYSRERVNFLFDTHRKVQQRLEIPALIGEWGAFTDIDSTYDLSIHILKIFEKYLWSNTFWCYFDGIEKCKFIKALNKGYPRSVNGTLLSYSYDYDRKSLTVEYQEQVANNSPTIIYHPDAANLHPRNIKMKEVETGVRIDVLDGTTGGYIYILPAGKDIFRKIIIE